MSEPSGKVVLVQLAGIVVEKTQLSGFFRKMSHKYNYET